jgi:hypothetical protein
MFNKQVELQAPFREAGLSAQNRLMTLLGLAPEPRQPGILGTMTGIVGGQSAGGNPSDPMFGWANRQFGDQPFTADPSYQFRLQQGQQALERSAAARGGTFSGRAAKDLTNYAQGAASQEYGNAYNRFQTDRANMLNPLQSLAGQAQSSANTVGQAAQTFGQQQGNNLMAAGNAQASGYMGMANTLAGGVNQYQNYQQNQNMMNLLGKNWGGSSVPSSADYASNDRIGG